MMAMASNNKKKKRRVKRDKGPTSPPTPVSSSSSSSDGEEEDDGMTENERLAMRYDTPVYRPAEAGTIEQYHIIDRIGGGAYGEVYLGVDLITREIVAVKRVVLNVLDAGVPFNIANEILYLDRLSHPNVIKSHRVVTSREELFTEAVARQNGKVKAMTRRGMPSYGIRQGSIKSAAKVSIRRQKKGGGDSTGGEDAAAAADTAAEAAALDADKMMEKPSMNVESDGNPAVYIVLEYMDYDLNNLIRSHRKNRWMPMCMIKYIMFQMLRGLEYLDGNRVVHLDLKPNNVLLDQRGHLRIGDFGLATSYDPLGRGQRSDRVNFIPATLWYRPPDLLLSNSETRYRIAHQIDVWSAGCIFGEMMSGDPMFPGRDEWEMLKRIFYICGSPSSYEFPDAFEREKYPGGYEFMKRHFNKRSPQPNRIQQLYRDKAKRCYEREYEIKYDREHVQLDTYDCTTSALDLLSKLLTLDPRRRISARTALQHPFFSESDLDSDMLTMPQFADLLNRVSPCDPIPDTRGVQSHRSYRENFTDPTLTVCAPVMGTSEQTTPYTRRQPSSSVYIQRTPKQHGAPKTPQDLLRACTPLVGHIVYQPGVSPGTVTMRRKPNGFAATVHMMGGGGGVNHVGNVTRAAMDVGGGDTIMLPPPSKRRKIEGEGDDDSVQ